ncbi:MAG: hypothetical protein FWH51_04500, partial [Dehalococcoidia bacterium]|nr:hypothetical protein [Dehalococcoidia bacterium]
MPKTDHASLLLSTMLALVILLTTLSLSFAVRPISAESQTIALLVTSDKDSGSGTLRDILENVAEDGDTIIFAPSITVITLLSEIKFSQKNVTIDGGHGIIISKDISGIFRLFNCTAADSTLTLAGLIFENGNIASNSYYDSFGGGVLIYDSATIVNCAFINNKAGSGGGVYIGGGVYTDGSCTISDCTFIGNKAVSNNAYSYGGGVSAGFDATLVRCTFTNNSADFGGGVYTYGIADLDACAFSHNTAQYGIVYSWSAWSTPTIVSDTTFFANTINNSTYTTGILDAPMGAILRHSTFAGNAKTSTNSVYNVHLEEPSLTIENCLMTLDGLDGHSNMSFGGDNLLGTGT